MRELHLVGTGDDGLTVVLETPDGAEQFVLPVDERLRAASRVDLAQLGGANSEQSTYLAPRDIQVRVRSGETPEAIAAEAGMSLERVMRFAYPVLQERARVTDEARRGRVRRSPDRPAVSFGELIDGRLQRHGIEASEVRWDSFRRADGGWTVTAEFTAVARPFRVKFSFALPNRTISALDDLAADLLSERPVTALLQAPAVEAPAAAEMAGAPGTGDTSSPAAATGQTPAPAATGAGTGQPAIRLAAVTDSSPASPTSVPARPRAHTRPLPVGFDEELPPEDLLDDEFAADQDVPNLSTGTAVEPSVELWQAQELPLDIHPDELPAGIPEQAEDQPEGSPDKAPRRGRNTDKPRMPSWDDILLGVRRKPD
jgi:hypothetical protein